MPYRLESDKSCSPGEEWDLEAKAGLSKWPGGIEAAYGDCDLVPDTGVFLTLLWVVVGFMGDRLGTVNCGGAESTEESELCLCVRIGSIRPPIASGIS